MVTFKEIKENFKNIDVEKCREKCKKHRMDFNKDTCQPKRITMDGLGQFVAVGKLKEATDHLGKGINVATIRITHVSDNGEVIPHRIDMRLDEIKNLGEFCKYVVDNWKMSC